MGETHKKELCRSRPRTASHVKARKREGGGGKKRAKEERRARQDETALQKKKKNVFFRPSYFWCNKKRDKERQCKEGKAKRENAHTAFYFFSLNIFFFFLMVARHVHNSIKDWREGEKTHKNKQLGFNENEHTERKKERRSSTVKTGVESLSYSGSAGKAK